MKQTAVEWLVEKLMKGEFINSPDELIDQAKQMEKEQHHKTFYKGYDRRTYLQDVEYGGAEYWKEEPKEFEQYYNETYKTNEQ